MDGGFSYCCASYQSYSLRTKPNSLLPWQQAAYSDMRVFGCIAYVHNLDPHRHKLSPKAKICVLVGYDDCSKGYRCFDLSSRNVSRHVTFDESNLWVVRSHFFILQPKDNPTSLFLMHSSRSGNPVGAGDPGKRGKTSHRRRFALPASCGLWLLSELKSRGNPDRPTQLFKMRRKGSDLRLTQ